MALDAAPPHSIVITQAAAMSAKFSRNNCLVRNRQRSTRSKANCTEPAAALVFTHKEQLDAGGGGRREGRSKEREKKKYRLLFEQWETAE
jgi:hypothetical protein